MKIIEILKNKNRSFSFEFFPPKNNEDVDHLLETAASLKKLDPTYISVTWGAGGSTRQKTLDIVATIKQKLNVESMAHLTCVGASKEEVSEALEEISRRGIENVLPLRGDPPRGQNQFIPHPNGFHYANELISHIRKNYDFCLATAGYPEKHPESDSMEKDMENLKRKIGAGADFIITQLFFNNEDYFRFRDKAASLGIHAPIIPGIMPITNVSQIKRFTNMCGAKIPQSLFDQLEPIQEDMEKVTQMGIQYGIKQCEALLKQDAPGIHFYTLNRSRSTTEILKNLR